MGRTDEALDAGEGVAPGAAGGLRTRKRIRNPTAPTTAYEPSRPQRRPTPRSPASTARQPSAHGRAPFPTAAQLVVAADDAGNRIGADVQRALVERLRDSADVGVARLPEVATGGSANSLSHIGETADLTGKQHAHVMRDIRKMLEALGKDVSGFGSIYQDAYGRDQQECRLDRDDFDPGFPCQTSIRIDEFCLPSACLKARQQKGHCQSWPKCLIPWWRQAGSNRRPSDCEPDALPAELCPQVPSHSMRRDRQRQSRRLHASRRAAGDCPDYFFALAPAGTTAMAIASAYTPST